jgi:hypothetical protein
MLQIFSIHGKGYEHIIDLQLTQGHPIVFLSLSNKLYTMI